QPRGEPGHGLARSRPLGARGRAILGRGPAFAALRPRARRAGERALPGRTPGALGARDLPVERLRARDRDQKVFHGRVDGAGVSRQRAARESAAGVDLAGGAGGAAWRADRRCADGPLARRRAPVNESPLVAADPRELVREERAGGRLHVDRGLPFLCLFRDDGSPRARATAEIASAMPAYAVLADADQERQLERHVHAACDKLGGFFLVELLEGDAQGELGVWLG